MDKNKIIYVNKIELKKRVNFIFEINKYYLGENPISLIPNNIETLCLINKYFFRFSNLINLKYSKYGMKLIGYNLSSLIQYRSFRFLISNKIAGWNYRNIALREENVILNSEKPFPYSWWITMNLYGSCDQVDIDDLYSIYLEIKESYINIFNQFFKDLERMKIILPLIKKLKP